MGAVSAAAAAAAGADGDDGDDAGVKHYCYLYSRPMWYQWRLFVTMQAAY